MRIKSLSLYCSEFKNQLIKFDYKSFKTIPVKFDLIFSGYIQHETK